jgi:hypothetical protein
VPQKNCQEEPAPKHSAKQLRSRSEVLATERCYCSKVATDNNRNKKMVIKKKERTGFLQVFFHICWLAAGVLEFLFEK